MNCPNCEAGLTHCYASDFEPDDTGIELTEYYKCRECGVEFEVVRDYEQIGEPVVIWDKTQVGEVDPDETSQSERIADILERVYGTTKPRSIADFWFRS